MEEKLINFVKDIYKTNDFIPLHAPQFNGNEKKYLLDTIDSTFVSSVGKYVDQFENQVQKFTKANRAVAVVNGTAALHSALYASGVREGDLVLTQALTFVATCNALKHMGAEPIFIDVSKTSLGLCPNALEKFLEENTLKTENAPIHKGTKKKITAVVPMHTFGHPVELDELISVCNNWNIPIIEDAAESLGSFYKDQHTGTLGDYGALSFNGNKIITTGGGGVVLCKSTESGERLKHLTTTAKVPHPYEFNHDEAGFNYRMPNLNAALGCAQLEVLNQYLQEKREIANLYIDFFKDSSYEFVKEPKYATSNYWLNAVICEDEVSRTNLIEKTNSNGVMTRPIWKLMHRLSMYENCLRGDLKNSEWLEKRIVNLPSSPRNKE